MKFSTRVGWLIAMMIVSGCASAAPVSNGSDAPATAKAPVTDAPPAATPVKGEDGCMVGEIGEVDESAVLTMGPPEGIRESTAVGEPMVITGVIVNAECKPIAGGGLHVWQTD